MSALSPRQMFLLDEACKPLRALGDFGPYLVGTAVTGSDWHDVDVRLILTDERYDELAAPLGWTGMALLGLVIGEYLASRTGLPIDFQVQRAAEANEYHSTENGGTCRNPLGRRTIADYAGDAHGWRSDESVRPARAARGCSDE